MCRVSTTRGSAAGLTQPAATAIHLPSLAWEEIGPLRKALGHTAELLETELMIHMLKKRWKEALTLAVRYE